MDIVPVALAEYAHVHSSREDPLLAELAEYTARHAKLPQMLSGHVAGSFLRMLVTVSGARRVLEIGTYTGYSALSMAMGLPADGCVITCDVDPVATEIARSFWARSSQGSKIELRMGPALETVEGLAGELDFVFIDADKENYVAYWEACLPKVRRGGLLVIDNVLWSGKVLNPREKSDHAIVAFNQHVRYDQRVDAVMLSVRDGITVARKL